MYVVSLDIETTAIDPENGEILSIGAVAKNTQTNETLGELFVARDLMKGELIRKGESYALEMNKELIELCKKGIEAGMYPEDIRFYSSEEDMVQALTEFLHEIKRKVGLYTIIGKNASTFDIPWLQMRTSYAYQFVGKLLDFWGADHRVIDLGSMYLEFDDMKVPNIQKCFDRAGLNKEVSHTALQDARDTYYIFFERVIKLKGRTDFEQYGKKFSYKDNTYVVVGRAPFKHPESRQWVDSFSYHPVGHPAQIYHREREEFLELFTPVND